MRRVPWTSVFLRVLLLISLLSSTQSASTRSRGKKKIAKETKEINVCEIEDQDTPIYCYCNNNAVRNATEAKCLVLRSFNSNDPTWDYFGSQIYLEELTFNVKMLNGLETLEYIPTQLLRRLKNLRKITFHYAKIDQLPEYAFSNLSTIAYIDLNKNSISSLRMHAFENMTNLTVVALNENRITEINRDTFVDLPSLKRLLLSHNNISTLHDKAFKHLITLEELELSDNRIQVITGDSFHSLRNLLRLDLRNNLIDMIGDRTFIEMPSLRDLELDSNKIVYISEKALQGLKNLRKLSLSDNKLITLEPDFLAGAPGVYFLDLRDNQLKTITFDNVKPIVSNMYNSTSHLFLNGNNLICDCKLAWIWALRNETKNRKLRDALEKLTCFLESNNASRKINNADHEWNEALEIARHSPKEYLTENIRTGKFDTDNAYLGDEYESEDGYEDTNSDSQPKVQVIEGKSMQVRNLFELKMEELPCPEPSREDLMASEQPSSRHENAPVGSSGSIWFSSTAKSIHLDLPVFAYTFVLLLARPMLFIFT
ncbi:connectin [Hylaeus anthracinus]|uniref:connectin n=1 Tax=Hylaeus anthracinus TaxID=313031 RepID=UPI0023B9F672|nr:connectin [Hylaeus anthracinus]XP_053996315.1 connectin [Hylaeus anthracinus]XP_053996316.1 connectin [Hylaeus anthracinus]XP_053996317.1 connectin [Hylaeus anthracinus]